MPLGCNAVDDGMVVRQREGLGLLDRARYGVGVREDKARHPIRQRRFSNSGWTAKQPGMREPAAAISIEENLLGVWMAIECSRAPRRGRLNFGIGTRPARAHEATPCSAGGVAAGLRRATIVAQIRSATAARGSVESMTTQRLGSRAANER